MNVSRTRPCYHRGGCFVASGWSSGKEAAMDVQTVIAICAIFSVVVGIVGLGRR